MHPFRSAVEAADLEAVADLLDDEIVFYSPVAFKPYTGTLLVGGILRAVFGVFEDFEYDREIGSGDDPALVFTARVDDKQLEGCDFIHTNAEGKIDRFTVMVRPLSAAQALAERMAVEFANIQPDG